MRRLVWSGLGVVATLTLLGTLAAPTWAGESPKKERRVTIDQVPAPVKETILKEAGDHTIKEIEEITQGDVKTYEAEWVADGKEVEITVAADGKLLRTKTEAADDDDEDDDEDDDKDDDKDDD